MQSLLIGVKRFFKNKNTVTIIAIVVSLGVLYYFYSWRITKATEPQIVPYAQVVIGPNTYISSDMISTKKVPGKVVSGNVILDRSKIMGKYVNSDAVIPVNGLFYEDAVVPWEEISQTLYSNIPDDHTIFYLKVDKSSTYGNSIFPGNYIDLYYFTRKDGGITIGKFIESIQVLAVTDGNGKNVFETAGNPGTPSYLIFSVDEDLHLLLRKTIFVDGEHSLIPVPRNASYSENATKTTIVSSKIQKMILDRTVDVELSTLEGIGGGINE